MEAAVGGAPDDASQGCSLALSLPCLRVCVAIVQTCLTFVLEFKSCTTLSPVQLKRAGNKCVRCAQHTHKLFHPSGTGECHPSFMDATANSIKMFMGANELTQPQHRNTRREPKKHRPRQTDGQTDRQKHTHTHRHTHTHTPGRQECDMLGTSWWFP